MQLSATNVSVDPNLAPFLLGNFSPAAVGPESAAGAAPLLAGFAQLLAETLPANPGQGASEAAANGPTVPGDLLTHEHSAGGPWVFAAGSHPSNLAAVPSSAADLATTRSAHGSTLSAAAAATQPPVGATPGASAGRETATSGVVSSGAPKSESRGAVTAAPTMRKGAATAHFVARSAARSDESESAHGTPRRTKSNAGKESPAEAILPATSPTIESPIAPAAESNHSAASVAASSVQAISEFASNAGRPAASGTARREIARAETLVVKGTRVPFSGVTASVVPSEKPEGRATGMPAAPTLRGADSISSVAPSVSTTGSSSPFAHDPPSRNLAEWPLTAQPKARSNAGMEGSGAEKALPATARDGVAVSPSVPLPAARADAANPTAFATVPVIANPTGSAASVVTNTTTPPANGSPESPSLSHDVPASSEEAVLQQPLSPRASQSSVPMSVTATPASLPGSPTPARAGLGSGGDQAVASAISVPSAMPGEKFAVPSALKGALADGPAGPRAKSFVSSGQEKLTDQPPHLGTSVAKPLDPMFSAPPLPLTADAAHDAVAWAVAPGGEVSADLSHEMPSAPEALSTAHRAVEAVLTAVHRFSSRDQHAVSLQFTVGGADLSVRVEMRADEVRATFTTDSADLRAALAHEWHAAQSTPSGERPVRLASPIFASSEGSSFGAAGDQDASRHRQAQTPPTSEPFTLAGLRSRAARAAAFEASVPVVAPVISRAPLSTALHLHTLA